MYVNTSDSLYSRIPQISPLILLTILHDRAWRHWGCTTPVIINNMKKSFSTADELDGFDELQPVDQEKVRQAWDDGHVADEDIPETARKPEGDDEVDEAKPKKKRAQSKKDDGKSEVPKPKKARTSKKVS
jgi:hypothetical protein